jgi:histone H3/H4
MISETKKHNLYIIQFLIFYYPKIEGFNMAKNAKVITKTALRRLMKEEGLASIVAADAVMALLEYLQDTATGVTKKALELAKHAKRKTITKADIKLAV